MRKRNSSGRVTLKTKYTNIKKNKSRKEKVKRDMKKNPNNYHRKKSDPGVPNNAPFKLEMLKERNRLLEMQEREKQRKRTGVLNVRKAMKDAKVGAKRKLTDVITFEGAPAVGEKEDGSDIEEDVADEEEDSVTVGEDDATEEKDSSKTKKSKPKRITAAQLAKKAKMAERYFTRDVIKGYKNKIERDEPDYRWRNWSDKVFYKQVKEVVESANVILQVLDARDPLGTRCTVLEGLIRTHPNKKLVLVLNKADLIPKSNLQAWLKHLRSEAPTVAFKAAVQRTKKFRSQNERWSHLGEEAMRTPAAMGCDVLVQLLKNYARSFPDTGIVVGVVGLPNVGKSSLINSLKKSKTCGTGMLPGLTKTKKTVKLDRKLEIVDTPGVVLPAKDMDPIEAVLKNVVKISAIINAPECALEIFRRSDSLKLAMFYNTRNTDNGEEFLRHLAKRLNKVEKTGVYGDESAAYKLIYDWIHGNLKHYTEPPKFIESEVKSSVKSGLSPAFDLDTLTMNKEETFLHHCDDSNVKLSETMKLTASEPIDKIQYHDLLLNEQNMDASEPAAMGASEPLVGDEPPELIGDDETELRISESEMEIDE